MYPIILLAVIICKDLGRVSICLLINSLILEEKPHEAENLPAEDNAWHVTGDSNDLNWQSPSLLAACPGMLPLYPEVSGLHRGCRGYWPWLLEQVLAASFCEEGHRDPTRIQFSSVQSLSRFKLFATPWTVALQASLSITSSRSLLKLMSIESVMLSNHLIFCRALLLLPSIFSCIRVFSNELALHIKWSKYWSFSISPSNEFSGLI